MEFKEKIKNRKGLNVVVLVEQAKKQENLVFLMHGFGSFKEFPLIEEIARIFKANNFTVVRFDATNSIGESDGELQDGTITGYCEDLNDVIIWAENQEWHQEPFLLAGHSAGGYCVSEYAAENPKEVKALAIFSPFISGKLFIETDEIKAVLPEWEKTGIRKWESSSSQGVIKKSGYQFIEDSLKLNILDSADKIKCPVLFVSGGKDLIIPIKDQKLFFDKLNTQKDFYLIKGADHNLKNEENFQDLRKIVENWSKNFI
ncbi:MAG: alpha/beta fold hydrolase [bacterium]|nr:alpha/beta fold hydrolase [bacterium]